LRAKITGICRKTDALPTPAKKKSASMSPTKSGNDSTDAGATVPVAAITSARRTSAIPARCVRMPPPVLSETNPKRTRAVEPTSGPRKA
jgi:hypothetical protein